MTATVTVPTSLGGTGTVYRDDDGTNGMASDGGFGYVSQGLLFEMLAEVITANQTSVTAAAGATNAANVNGTSTSSVAVGTATGTATFVMVEADRAIREGMYLLFANTGTPANFIFGPVVSFDSGTKTVVVTKELVGGSGTLSAWTVTLSGPRGPAGAGSGDVTGPASAASDGNVALFDGTGGKTLKDGGTRAAWLAAGINGATGKTTPVDADEFALIDSAASNVLKKLTWANLKATLWVALGPAIAAFTSKASPVGADEFAITDSAASGATKRVSLTNIAAFLASLAQTLTNKRVTARVGSTTSSATPTINTDNVDVYRLTAQTADITSFTTNLTGTPSHDDTLVIEVTGTGARAITWGSSFEASTVALPTTTVSTNMLQVSFLWNSATSKWRCVGSC